MGAINHMLSSPDLEEREVSRAYFDWILDIVDVRDTIYPDYSSTIHYLFSREFYYIIQNDDSREADGRFLRVDFENLGQFADYHALWDGPASVLEVLIAMARRMDEDWLRSSDFDPNFAAKCFDKMFENLGLYDFSNENIGLKSSRTGTDGFSRLEEVVDRFLNRDFDRDGSNGSPFPLKNCHFNARKEEFWVLMSNFCNENYDILTNFG